MKISEKSQKREKRQSRKPRKIPKTLCPTQDLTITYPVPVREERKRRGEREEEEERKGEEEENWERLSPWMRPLFCSGKFFLLTVRVT